MIFPRGWDVMTEDKLTAEEKQTLLELARQALEDGVRGHKLTQLDLQALTPRLREPGASFVTLTVHGNLRGCIGALEPYQSLADDVREHAIAAALQDYRFPNVRSEELSQIDIEVSRLTHPVPLEYTTPEDLLSKLRPGIDGVVLRDGARRATFLPQVWEKLPDPADFLDNLCYKMGAAPDLWRKKHLDVLVYQVEEFHE
jgi:AmmeMemoRadiSam system protein A